MSINWKQKASVREQGLSALVILALGVMFFRFFYLPRRAENRELSNQMTSLELEKSALEKFTAALSEKSLSPVLNQKRHRTALEVLAGRVQPVASEIADLLGVISQPDFLKGVQVESLHYLPLVQEKGFRKTAFVVKVKGSFSSVVRYVKRLGDLPALLIIDGMAMESPGREGGEIHVEISGSFMELEPERKG